MGNRNLKSKMKIFVSGEKKKKKKTDGWFRMNIYFM